MRQAGVKAKVFLFADKGWTSYATTVSCMEDTVKNREKAVAAFDMVREGRAATLREVLLGFPPARRLAVQLSLVWLAPLGLWFAGGTWSTPAGWQIAIGLSVMTVITVGALRHLGSRHLGSDPAWWGQTPKGGFLEPRTA